MNAVTAIDDAGFYSVNDAAKVLGKAYYEVYNLLAAGRLTRVKQGSRVLVPAVEVQAFMDDPEHFSARHGIAFANPINWHPIEAIPNDRMDGRNMLLWVVIRWTEYPAIGTWCDGWRDAVGNLVSATYWADVEGPE